MVLLVRQTADGIRLAVKVMPKSRRPGVLGLAPDIDGDRLRVGVTPAPEGGRANVEVRAVISVALRVAIAAVSVAHGASSRQKLLRVTGDPSALMARAILISTTTTDAPA
jgi:uncharacterized protein YggU (UPF0235/DUF167 family)